MQDTQMNVPHVFASSIALAAKKVVGFSMAECNRQLVISNAEVITIQSKGSFASTMEFRLELSLVEAILKGMKARQLEDPGMRESYLAEFVNIISGHALTAINNATEEISRLTVPRVGKENAYEKQGLSDKFDTCFTSEYGKMEVLIEYSLNAVVYELT